MERGKRPIGSIYQAAIDTQKQKSRNAKYNQTRVTPQGRAYSDISDPKNQTLTNADKADLGPPVSLPEDEAPDDYDDELDECAIG